MQVMEAIAIAEPALRRLACRLAGRGIDADDLMAEAVFRAWVSLKDSDCEPGYVVRRGRFAMLDALRKWHGNRYRDVRRVSLEQEQEAGFDLAASGDDYERADWVEMLRTIPPRPAAVLYRKYYLEETQGHIAQDWDVSPARVAQLAARGLACLRHELAAGGGNR